MSDLVKSNNELLLLAEELNINLDSENSDLYSAGNSNKITSYIRPKKIRTVFDAYKSDGVIKWTPLNSDRDPSSRQHESLFVPSKETDGEPTELGNIIEIRGIIVNYQQRDELRYYDGEKTNILCSVIGYQSEGSLLKALPNTPYGMKYAFEKDMTTNKWSVNNNRPNPSVEKLGLVGYRGEKVTSCADCIKCGFSSEIITGAGEGGADKKITCDPRGKLYLAVFEVVTKKKIKQEDANGKSTWVDGTISYPISSLLDSSNEPVGEFIFVEIPLSKSNIQGRTVKNSKGQRDSELTVVGYETYCRDLTYQFKNVKDPLRHSKFHYTSVSFRKSPGGASIFQADFRSLGAVSTSNFKVAYTGWESILPVKTIEVLELPPIQSIEVDGTINVVSSVIEANPLTPTLPINSTIRTVTSEVLSESELPF